MKYSCRPRRTTAWMNRTNSTGADFSPWPTSSTFRAFGTRGDVSTASISGDVVMAAATASTSPAYSSALPVVSESWNSASA